MLNRTAAYRFAIASVGVLLLLAACDDGPGTTNKIRPPTWIQGTWDWKVRETKGVPNLITSQWSCNNYRFTADDVICTIGSDSAVGTGKFQRLFSGYFSSSSVTMSQSVTDTVYTLTFKAGDREEIYRWTLTAASKLDFVVSIRSRAVVAPPQGSLVYEKA